MFLVGINPAKVDTVAQYALGLRGVDQRGVEFIYVKGLAALAQYAWALQNEDGTIAEVTTTTAAGGTGSGKQVCIPQVALAINEFGWAAVYGGVGTIRGLLAASCVKYTQLNTTATAGVVDDAPTAAFIMGAVSEVTVTGAAAAFVKLTYPYVSITI